MLSDFAIYERCMTQPIPPPSPPTRWKYSCNVCDWLLISWACMLGGSFIQHNINPHSNFSHPYSLVHIYTRSALHVPLLRYPPLLLRGSFIEHNTNLHSIFSHPYLLVYLYTCSDLHVPLLRYPPLLPQKAGRPKHTQWSTRPTPQISATTA